jgi:hypothetical protein
MSFIRTKLNDSEPKWQPLPYNRAIFKSILSWKTANDERKLEYDQQVEAFKSKVAAHEASEDERERRHLAAKLEYEQKVEAFKSQLAAQEASEDERERKHLAARVSSTFALTRGAI